MIDKKISVIVPVYNAEKFLGNCLECLLGQTYRNIEIILVNDGSKGNCKEIYEKYSKIDSRVKYVEHEVNKGLFQARITGVKKSTGDYIAFLDSDDHITVDYFRALIYKAEEENADITFANMILEYSDGKQIQYNLFDTKFEDLNGNEPIEEFFNQEGLNFSWHTTPNKIYSRRIWELALNEYNDIRDHLVMTEDFSFSTVLFYYAKKVVKLRTEAMFYCKHDSASTSVENISFSKIEKNLKDLIVSFNFVENFLKKKNIYEKYGAKFQKWKSLYCQQHKAYVSNVKLSKEEKNKVDALFNEFCPNGQKIKNDGFFSSICTVWDNSLDEVKRKILDSKVKCVSFDIFDTLILRPFLVPKDMFILLNKYFIKINKDNSSIDFSVMREVSENLARQKVNDKKQEITIDEIYNKMQEIYNISDDVASYMKNLEIEYEMHYCTRRNTGFELYQLAKYLGKKVICVSDMYIGKDTLKNILVKNGYDGIDEIYSSCENNATKSTGELFKVVSKIENFEPGEFIHIGDNYQSDYEIPQKLGYNAVFFPRTISIALDKNYSNNLFQIFAKDLPFWEDNVASMGFFGIRSMLAMVANKYFDNPYRSFNKGSNFNSDPELIGYYVLGMYLFGIGKWLADDVSKQKYESMVFMARDGYLPMQAYRIFKKIYTNLPEEKYLYVSRKALIPAIIQEKKDFYKITEVINIYKNSPKQVFHYIKDTVDYDETKLKSVCQQNGIDINKNFKDILEFNNFIKLIIENFYNETKHKKNLEKLKSYYNGFYKGKSANFDIGYSGRPEFFISRLCNKSIDTYFININCDEAIKYSNNGGFKLKTFFEYKPHITGNLYELSVSALAPSCIGYNFENSEVLPVFEKYSVDYQQEFIINKIQKSALEFVYDMVDTFSTEINELYYQNYYTTLPMQSYIHSSNEIDRTIFSAFSFEDDIRNKEKINVNYLWSKECMLHNQHNVDQLLMGNIGVDTNCNVQLGNVDLSNRNKLVRLIYYTFFDRITLKRRVNEILYNHKIAKKFAKKTYNVAKKMKRH